MSFQILLCSVKFFMIMNCSIIIFHLDNSCEAIYSLISCPYEEISNLYFKIEKLVIQNSFRWIITLTLQIWFLMPPLAGHIMLKYFPYDVSQIYISELKYYLNKSMNDQIEVLLTIIVSMKLNKSFLLISYWSTVVIHF